MKSWNGTNERHQRVNVVKKIVNVKIDNIKENTKKMVIINVTADVLTTKRNKNQLGAFLTYREESVRSLRDDRPYLVDITSRSRKTTNTSVYLVVSFLSTTQFTHFTRRSKFFWKIFEGNHPPSGTYSRRGGMGALCYIYRSDLYASCHVLTLFFHSSRFLLLVSSYKPT